MLSVDHLRTPSGGKSGRQESASRLEAYVRTYIANRNNERFNNVDYFFTQSRLKFSVASDATTWANLVTETLESMILKELLSLGRNIPGVSYEWLAGVSAAVLIDVSLFWINYLTYPVLGAKRWFRGELRIRGRDVKSKLLNLRADLLKLSPTIETTRAAKRLVEILLLYNEALERR